MIWFRDTVRKIMRRDTVLTATLCILLIAALRSLSLYLDISGALYPVLILFFLLITPALIYLDIESTERKQAGSDPLHPNRQLSEKGIYGTAHPEYPWDYRAYAQIRPLDKCVGIVLGQLTLDGSQCIDFFPDPQDPLAHANNHIFASGNSGSGKTFTFGKTYCFQAMKYHRSVMHTDPKGELYRDLADIYRQHGYIVRRLNFIDPEMSDGWDCLKTIKEETRPGRIAILTQVFAEATVSNAIGGDPSSIYYTAPKLLLQALILRLVLDDTIPDEKKNMHMIYDWLCDPGGLNFLDNLFDPITLTERMKPCLNPYVLYKSSSGNLAGNIIVNLGSGIQILGVGPIAEILSRDEFDLALPGDRPCAYFVQFPVPNDSYRFPVALFFAMLFRTLQDKAIDNAKGRLNREVCFFLDEFAQCGTLPSWAAYMSVIRSYGMNVFMIVQTISQFIDLYKDSYNTIISACAVWLMIGANDPDTAKYFSDRCGRASYISLSESRQGIRKLFGLKNSSVDRTTEGTGQGNLLTPDEIIRIPPNQVIILLQKHNPIFAYTVKNTMHPYAAERITPVPRDYERDFLEQYWKTHSELSVPDNIDDAPYSQAPTIWGDMAQVLREDYGRLINFLAVKTKLKIPAFLNSSAVSNIRTEECTQDILYDDSESFNSPLYISENRGPADTANNNLSGIAPFAAVQTAQTSEPPIRMSPSPVTDEALADCIPESGFSDIRDDSDDKLAVSNESDSNISSPKKECETKGPASQTVPVQAMRFASKYSEPEPISSAELKRAYAKQKSAFVQEAVSKRPSARQIPPSKKK